jgi:perosamine synthetase
MTHGAQKSLADPQACNESLVAPVLGAVRSVIGDAPTPIALHEPEFSGNELAYLKECLDTGWVSSVGPFVERFERELAGYTGSGHVVATSNGTAALHVCLQVVGVRPGDEVLLPALTFVATANAVSYCSAVPHFVDSEATSFGVDPVGLDAYLRETVHLSGGVCMNRRTGAPVRALIVVHVFGHPANLDGLREVADRWRLALVEDAAESLGSRLHERHAGTSGVVAALSFNGNKVVTTGGGGAVLTNDAVLAARVRHLSTTARVKHRWDFLHDEVGYNYRMPNVNAALGCAQLEQLPHALERKRLLAQRYIAAFAGIDGVRIVREPEGTRSNYWLNTLLLDADRESERDRLLTALNDAGYGARPIWTLMHRLPMYSRCPRMTLACAEQLAARVINLPSSAKLGGP